MKTNLTHYKEKKALDVIIKIGVSIIKEFPDKDTPKNQEIGLLKPFIDEMKEFSSHQKGEFEILKANSINLDYVKKITPVVLLTNYFSDVVNWKSTAHTLIFGCLFTFSVLYFQMIILLGLILFYINTPFFLRQILKIQSKTSKKNLNLFEKNKEKLFRFKRNMTHIQETQKDYIKKYDHLKKLLFSDDPTQLIEILLIVRKYVFIIVPFLLSFSPSVCLVICFWLFLIRNSTYGSSLFEEFQIKLNRFLDIFNEKIDYFVSRFKLFPVPPPQTQELRKISDNLHSQKTFVIYENQRWWLGKGWIDLMLPGGLISNKHIIYFLYKK